MSVTVPNVPTAQTSEESKGNSTLDDLLAHYEEDLGIDNSQYLNFEPESGAQIAAEVNLLKQASEQIMEVAIEREQSLSQGEAIDKFMPTTNVMRTMQSIDEQKTREIGQIPKSDP